MCIVARPFFSPWPTLHHLAFIVCPMLPYHVPSYRPCPFAPCLPANTHPRRSYTQQRCTFGLREYYNLETSKYLPVTTVNPRSLTKAASARLEDVSSGQVKTHNTFKAPPDAKLQGFFSSDKHIIVS